MKRRMLVLAALTAMLALPAQAAFAFHCTVADKPAGAGAGTLADVREAGASGKLVYTGGAFLEVAPGVEVFVRGQPVDIGVQGIGTLPHGPHANGPDDHGVIDLAP